MKKIISTFALFMTFSVAAMANTCDQQDSTDVACNGSAASSARFAGLGGLFGNQRKDSVSVKYQYKVSSTRFVGLGGLFGHQDEKAVAVNFQQMNVATSARFVGLGGLFSGQRDTADSQTIALASTSNLFFN